MIDSVRLDPNTAGIAAWLILGDSCSSVIQALAIVSHPKHLEWY